MPSPHRRELIVVGLGPGIWESLTLEAATILQSATEIYVRTSVQPSLAPIRSHIPNVAIHSFDRLYDTLAGFDEIYERIVAELARLVEKKGTVVYAVPGSPSVGEATVALLLQQLAGTDITVRLVAGISFVEPVLAAAGIADAGWIEVIDAGEVALMAAENAVGEVEGEDGLLPWRSPVPTAPLLISQLYSRDIAGAVKLWLGRYYPDEHEVTLVKVSNGRSETRQVPLYELDRGDDIDHTTALHVPALSENENARTFSGLMQVTRRLRGPGGCPWDREQTNLSLKPYLLEEAYEVLDALDSEDPNLLAEELGDLLFQIAIHSQVAAEAGHFTIEDVLQNIICKMIGRHPHVFADLQLDTAHDVRQAWEGFKQREKPKRASVLEEIPRGLPALPRSNLMQKRAASVGFEWPNVEEVLAKVDEELRELRHEIAAGASRELQREEFGDILFALVSVARHLRVDPEEALRLANRKFGDRFQYVESRIAGEGRTMRELSPEALDMYWNEAKARASKDA